VKDWNVVISLYQDGFRRAIRALEQLGQVDSSPYHNVLTMKAEDPLAVLDAIERRTADDPALYDAISRVAPAMHNFEFQSADEFLDKAKSVALRWRPDLSGRSFHVRFHRRGMRHDLPTPDVERALDDALLQAANSTASPASISFDDPDAVIVIDTVGHRAGISLWRREDLARHPLLRPD
jgi:tRNA(Ser,Leu) C12 N-acetylase TAN1